MSKRPRDRGQVLAGVLILLMIVSVMVPLMVYYAQRESVWTAKQARNTQAFHLAEAGLEKGYLAISLSTITWVNLQNAILLDDYQFDRAYTDVQGGMYTISVTSGPGVQQATIISIGRDNLGREVRALKAVYSNSIMGGNAIYAGGGVQIDGGVNVEWGSVMSPRDVYADGRLHPQFWSAGKVDSYDSDPNPPNCDGPDCCQFHAYSNQVPPQPTIDLNFYKASATATSTYYNTNQTWKGVTDLTGKTHYVDANLTLASPGIDITGTLIVTGTMDTGSGVWGSGSRTMPVPQTAWKQYCRDWATYRATYDGLAPATFPGLNSDYQSAAGLTYTSNKISVSGLLYVGGAFVTGGGGGQADVHGVFLVVGTSTMTNNSGVNVYYNETAAQNIQTTKIYLVRQSWQDVMRTWPPGL